MKTYSVIGKRTSDQQVDLACQWVNEAKYVLYTSGAGLTAAAGIDYGDTKLFAREFPAMLQYGFRAQYQLIGFDDWTPDLQWGYWAAHVNLVRFNWPKSDVYQSLLGLSSHISSENTFVMTSNVDAMFERNGFDEDRIYTPQGDYALLQCTKPCTQEVWPWKKMIDEICEATDPDTQRLLDQDLIPSCPNCGGTVFPNVRIDQSFIHNHFNGTAKCLNSWLEKAETSRGVVIEVGAGFNTPSVIRWPGEEIVEYSPHWKLVRINRDYSDIPEKLSKKAVGLKGNATAIISELKSNIHT